MADVNISNGVWFDTKNSKVVDSPPEEGVQVVAPGTEMTASLEADIQRYRDLEAGVVNPPETISVEATAETTDTGSKPKAK